MGENRSVVARGWGVGEPDKGAVWGSVFRVIDQFCVLAVAVAA